MSARWTPNPKEITVHGHRNGCGGERFTAITFTQEDSGEPHYDGNLIAIVPADDGKKHDIRCYVVHTTKPDLCYRGDNYNSVMQEIIKAHDIKVGEQLDYACQHPTKEGEPWIDPCITHFKNMGEVRETITPSRGKRFEGIIQVLQ